ncbi:MAG: preprotein translocase subunit SecE [Rickettsiaceae bacterium]|nr:preprotein translocase subunit SecE [Rickettsiaceae bacterium]
MPVAPAKRDIDMISSIRKFWEQVKQELKKITWPTRQEVLTATLVVLVVVLVASLIILSVDYLINAVIQFLLRLGK